MQYQSNLKQWGSDGIEYPDGYKYEWQEPPVDGYDNFYVYNVIEDLNHLIGLTNSRLDTSAGTEYPEDPEEGHVVWRYDLSRLGINDNGVWEEAAFMSDLDELDFSHIEEQIADHEEDDQVHGVSEGVVASTVDIEDGIDDHTSSTVHDLPQPPESHGSEAHDIDDLHNDAVGIPTYSDVNNVPTIPTGHAVFVDGNLYIEDGN